MASSSDTATSGNDPSLPLLERLPGTPYARYSLPIDYLPSRVPGKRWGTAERPTIEWMAKRFSRSHDDYLRRIRRMTEVSAQMTEIPENFDESRLPMPAWYGVAYAPFDAVALCMMLETYKPKLFIEIGSGISTCYARWAINRFRLSTRILSIDPEPRQEIDAICDEVIRDGLEACDLSIFDRLEPGDVLFFDGSHRSFMNSDVTVFFGDVLARLKPGVIIHIHDISLPGDYPEFAHNWYWNEQYLLMAFLLGAGDKVDPLLPTAYLCNQEELMSTFHPVPKLSNLDGWRGGGAFWFTLREPIV